MEIFTLFGLLKCPRYRGIMSRHIAYPDRWHKLDDEQLNRPLGIIYRLYSLYPLYLAMRSLGRRMRLSYWVYLIRMSKALHGRTKMQWKRRLNS